jgi:hypothetical protein
MKTIARTGSRFKNCDIDKHKKQARGLRETAKKAMGRKVKIETFELEKK